MRSLMVIITCFFLLSGCAESVPKGPDGEFSPLTSAAVGSNPFVTAGAYPGTLEITSMDKVHVTGLLKVYAVVQPFNSPILTNGAFKVLLPSGSIYTIHMCPATNAGHLCGEYQPESGSAWGVVFPNPIDSMDKK